LQLEVDTDERTGEVKREWPRLVVFNSCTNWWRTMMELRESQKDPEDVDTDQEDHLYDTTRYLCMSRPIVPRIKHDLPAGSFAQERRRLIRAKDYARRHGTSLAAAYGMVR
jgi:hypothetical protein